MTRSLFVAALIALALAAPVSALNNRSAVSVNGLDTNPCTPASPCRSFTAALAQTSAGGEIIALDSAGYGPFTITTSVTVSGAPGVHAAITATFGAAILVNASSTDVVTIRNLVMIGSGGTHAVEGEVSGELRVLNCTTRNFTLSAIRCRSGRLVVDQCAVFDSGASSIIMDSLATVTVEGVISNSLIENNPGGVTVSAPALAIIRNCDIAGNNSGSAVEAFSTAGSARVFVESSSLAFNNIAVATSASGSNNSAIIYLAQDDITYSTVGVQVVGAGAVMSYGNNRFAEVPTVGPLSPVGLQ